MQKAMGVACNSEKYTAADAAFNAYEKAVLTHGGMAYTAEYDVEGDSRNAWSRASHMSVGR